jgi:hypothetical protein
MNDPGWLPVLVPGKGVLHIVPNDTVQHEVDAHGGCVCGPGLRWHTDGTGRRIWFYRHAPLSPAFYKTTQSEEIS